MQCWSRSLVSRPKRRFFFFSSRRRHTRWPRDWSSDVCSSDLVLRRWKEWRLPRGYARLGTKYGGWWIDGDAIGANPLMIDCGLGRDISFPVAFLARFGGTVVGIDPNPESLDYCRALSPAGMQVWDKAFWKSAGESQTFFLPRSKETLP